jgi:hypothetical protein
MDDNVVRLCVNGRKIEPGVNARLYTLRYATRLPTGRWRKFLQSTGSPLSMAFRRPYEKPHPGKKITARDGAVHPSSCYFDHGGTTPFVRA